MKPKLLSLLIVITLLALVGCAPSSNPTSKEGYGKAQPLVDLAKADLMKRLGVSLDRLTVQSVEATEFPDTSLGVPEPGKMYAQVITPGYIIKLVVSGVVIEYHGSGERVVRAGTLPPALGLQTLDGQGFVLHYPANAQVEVYEDHLRILGPEIAIRPADADWWWGVPYEMDIWIFDNPKGLSAADWARQYILSQWQEAQATGEPFTGPVINGQINEDAVAEFSVGGLPAFQTDWFGGDSTRRAIYVTDGQRVISLIFNLYPVENNPIAKVEEDIYALMLSTFRFSE